jgi:hypothetical protein
MKKSRRRRTTVHPMEKLESRWFLSASSLSQIDATMNLDLTAQSSAASISGYTPAEIKAAYGFSSISFDNGTITGNGAGQTIAIVDAYNDPNIASDLATFDSEFGLSAASLSVVSQTGSTTKLPATNAGWSEEISLDVEWAHAIAPAAKILLVEANSSSLSDLLTAENYARNAAGVSVVSMSWGASEFSGETSYDSNFIAPAGHTGETFVAASGDDGTLSGPEWPSVSPDVLAVGGTTLTIGANGAISSETAWSDSTGGLSQLEAEPTYQSTAQSTGVRTTADVSYDANPDTGFAVYDSLAYDGYVGWTEIGGTSAGAPQWSALIAIADQGRSLDNETALNGATGTLPELYSLAATSSTYAADFNDITSGGSFFASASAGYDLVTGLGSPKAAEIVSALVSSAAGADTVAATVSQTYSYYYYYYFGPPSRQPRSRGFDEIFASAGNSPRQTPGSLPAIAVADVMQGIVSTESLSTIAAANLTISNPFHDGSPITLEDSAQSSESAVATADVVVGSFSLQQATPEETKNPQQLNDRLIFEMPARGHLFADAGGSLRASPMASLLGELVAAGAIVAGTYDTQRRKSIIVIGGSHV